MATGAILSLLSVLAMARALTQQGPARVLPWALLVNATAFLIEWLAQPTSRDGVAVALYLHVATLGSVLLSGLWSLVSERFDPHRARTFVPRIAAGATFGGVIGGVVAHTVGSAAGARSMLLVLCAMSVLGALAILRVTARERAAAPPPETGDSSVSSLRVMARTPFLRALAAMSMLAAVWEALIDFSFKAMADAELGDEASLVRFFAIYYTGISLITFLLQTLLGKALLQRLRVESSLRSLPLFVAAGGLGLLFGAPFWLVGVVRGGESVLSNSLFRAAYELLFTPLPRETKRPTKTLVDVASTRVGDVIGSVLALGLVQWWRDMPNVVPIVVAAGVALIAVLLVDRLRASYVDALEGALRAGAVELEAGATLDATTRRTVTDTTTALDHERLRLELEQLRRASAGAGVGSDEAAAAAAAAIVAAQPSPQVEAEVPAVAPPPPDAAIVARFAALASGDPARMRAALREPLEPELVPVAIPLLAHPELGAEATDALRRAAPLAVGALIDRLVDPRTPFAVRFRIPRVLRAAKTARAAAGLIAGLDDPRLEVRFQCARGLVHLASHDPRHAPAPERVLAAVEREIAERGITWSAVAVSHEHGSPEHHADHEAHDDEPISLDELIRLRASRSLQYVLTMLSLVVDGEALQLALGGLSSNEDKIRGTAIELLENILPEPIRSSLVPLLETHEREHSQVRPRDEIVAELLRSQQSLPRIPRPA